MRCPRCHRKLAAGARCPADGSMPAGEDVVASVDAGAPPAIPGVQVTGLLAAGGQAAVWRVEGARVAKVAHAASPELARRFADEAAALAAIGPPAVARLIEHGRLADGRPYLLMEQVAGATLGAALEAAPAPLPVDELLAWARGLLDALARVHAAGWVHRDLAPENLVREPDGRVRLLDLGLAQRPGAEAAGVVAGTPLYIAPEQLRGQVATAATDLYGLGAILFEAATLRPPFAGDRATVELGHLTFRAPRASALRPLPPALDALIAACLAKAPADRPASARAAHAALAGAEAEAAVATAPVAAAQARTLVALVAVERAPASLNVDVEARRRGGQLARQLAGRAVLAFPPDEGPAPLAGALATAHALVAAGARATVHVAPLIVRRGGDGRAMLFGPPLDRPADWTAAAAGLALTDAAARELDPAELAPLDGAPGFHGLRGRELDAPGATAAVADAPALVGRDELLGAALASARVALGSGPPAAWIAVGGAGSGKSRVAAALAAALAAAEPDAAIVRLEGHRSFGAGADAARELHARLAELAPPLAATGPLPPTAALRAAIDAVLATRPLAIVIDDAQWIDDALLDALAVAVRAGAGALWVAACAADTVVARRPAWLDGARVTLATLAPLDELDARLLVRRLLAPARRVPDALVARLAARTGGVPGIAAALARELRRAGVVRRHPGSDVWFLAADELDFLPPTPGVHWFVARRLAALGPGLAELARAAALLGPRFGAAEVEAACDVGAAGVTVDAKVGLARLVADGLLVADGDAVRFRTEAEQDAIAQAVPAPARAQVHRAVLARLLAAPASDDADAWARVAFHAARAGEPAVAIAHLERLAAAARARHAPLEAVRWSTQAIELAADGATEPAVRQRLLGDRGRARRVLTHYEAARVDLAAARVLAEAAGDRVAVVDLLVGEAAVCDFTEQLAESARLVEDALARAPAELPAQVQARLDNWTGVVRARQERLPEARAALEAAIARGLAHGDHETAIGSMLMLGGVLRRLDLVGDGRAVLDGAIALCEAAGDHFHLAIALFNRINVWRRLGEAAPAEADAARAIEVANRNGLDQIELWGWYNLSELRWWHGDLEGAFAAAEASHRVGAERFRDAPPVVGSLWYAVLLAAAGDAAAATRVLDDVRGADVAANPSLALLRDAVRLACAGEVGAAWEPLLARASRPGAEEDAVYLWWLRGRTARRIGDSPVAAAAFAAAGAGARTLGRPAPPSDWPDA